VSLVAQRWDARVIGGEGPAGGKATVSCQELGDVQMLRPLT
jgi:hypothetical protein